MIRGLFALAAGIVLGAGGMYASHPHEDGEKVRVISATDIKEKLDSKEATATVVAAKSSPREGIRRR